MTIKQETLKSHGNVQRMYREVRTHFEIEVAKMAIKQQIIKSHGKVLSFYRSTHTRPNCRR